MATPSNKRPRLDHGVGHAGHRMEEAAEQKARKACINCRRQKMKCLLDANQTACRRCQRSGLPCIFVPRANAASLPESILMAGPCDDVFKRDVLRRLGVIEACLGLPSSAGSTGPAARGLGDTAADAAADEGLSPEFAGLEALWDSAAVLARSAPSSVPSSAWARRTVKELWSTFYDRLPALHFMPRRQDISHPHPVLLASILYCSSARGPVETADLAVHYFAVLCHAIAQLCIPGSEIGKAPLAVGGGAADEEEWAFQTVLAIVVASLLHEAHVRESGIWISVAYRLILQHCPPHVHESAREWRRLFSGVQIIDLEHASLHLSCPIIPIDAPLPGLQTSSRDQLYRLSRMMHTGLTHFTGRGLPTIWSCFSGYPLPPSSESLSVGGAGDGSRAGSSSSNSHHNSSTTTTFTPVDAAVIRDWARQLDEWLVEFSQNQRPDGPELDRQVVLRQYVLHRLVVLSIYHPARGCDLWSKSITPREQHELLLSARATLKLHVHDDSIWSNWDLIMITWAALIVIQGLQGGAGEPDDLQNIRIHLDKLKRFHEPKPSLRDKLIARLEESLVGVHTPVPAPVEMVSTATTTHAHHHAPQQQQQQPQQHQQPLYHNGVPMLGSGLSPVDQSWQIFDQASLQQMIYPTWSIPAHEQMDPI